MIRVYRKLRNILDPVYEVLLHRFEQALRLKSILLTDEMTKDHRNCL